MDRVVA
jgi:molecular chaperone IbpA